MCFHTVFNNNTIYSQWSGIVLINTFQIPYLWLLKWNLIIEDELFGNRLVLVMENQVQIQNLGKTEIFGLQHKSCGLAQTR